MMIHASVDHSVWSLAASLVVLGWVPLALAGASLAGKIFGGAGKGAADERQQQNDFLQRENQLRLGQYNTQQNALLQLLGLTERGTMDRAQLGMQAPNVRTKQSIIGSLLQNLQPLQVQPPAGVNMPQSSGGFNVSALNPMARAGGGELQDQALMALLSKSDVPAMPNYREQGMLPAPQMNQYKQPGGFEKVASAIGLGGGLLGALGPLMNRGQSQSGNGQGSHY